jgi:hypothetical protein
MLNNFKCCEVKEKATFLLQKGGSCKQPTVSPTLKVFSFTAVRSLTITSVIFYNYSWKKLTQLQLEKVSQQVGKV